MAHSNVSSTRHSFESFLNGWLVRQEDFLRRLLEAIEPRKQNSDEVELHRALTDEVLSHYLQYFQEQNRAAKDDVFLVLSPPWLTSMEILLLWVGGFKPLFVFKLIESSLDDLTADQMQRLESAKRETRNGELELSGTMAKLQESVASPRMLTLVQQFGRLIDAEVSEMDTAEEELKGGMLATLEAADLLRGETVSKAREILGTHQMVKLLAAFTQLHVRVRKWGQQREDNRAEEQEMTNDVSFWSQRA